MTLAPVVGDTAIAALMSGDELDLECINGFLEFSTLLPTSIMRSPTFSDIRSTGRDAAFMVAPTTVFPALVITLPVLVRMVPTVEGIFAIKQRSSTDV